MLPRLRSQPATASGSGAAHGAYSWSMASLRPSSCSSCVMLASRSLTVKPVLGSTQAPNNAPACGTSGPGARLPGAGCAGADGPATGAGAPDGPGGRVTTSSTVIMTTMATAPVTTGSVGAHRLAARSRRWLGRDRPDVVRLICRFPTALYTTACWRPWSRPMAATSAAPAIPVSAAASWPPRSAREARAVLALTIGTLTSCGDTVQLMMLPVTCDGIAGYWCSAAA